MAIVRKLLLDGQGRRADRQAAGGDDFEKAAGEHGRRVLDGIHIEAHHMLSVYLGGIPVGDLRAEVDPGARWVTVDIGAPIGVPVIDGKAELLGPLEQHVLPHAPTWMNVMAIAADKARPAVPIAMAGRRVQGGLDREHQRMHGRRVAERRAIAGHCIGVHSEDMVEQRGTLDETVKMDTVFLVPENAWDAHVARARNDAPKLVVVSFRMSVIGCYLEFPCIAFSIPCRFDQ